MIRIWHSIIFILLWYVGIVSEKSLIAFFTWYLSSIYADRVNVSHEYLWILCIFTQHTYNYTKNWNSCRDVNINMYKRILKNICTTGRSSFLLFFSSYILIYWMHAGTTFLSSYNFISFLYYGCIYYCYYLIFFSSSC